jgi:hypothetical protein
LDSISSQLVTRFKFQIFPAEYHPAVIKKAVSSSISNEETFLQLLKMGLLPINKNYRTGSSLTMPDPVLPQMDFNLVFTLNQKEFSNLVAEHLMQDKEKANRLIMHSLENAIKDKADTVLQNRDLASAGGSNVPTPSDSTDIV